MLTVVWLLVGRSLPELYYFALGSRNLTPLTVHIRYFRNLALFRSIVNVDALRGRVLPLLNPTNVIHRVPFVLGTIPFTFRFHSKLVHVGWRHRMSLDGDETSQLR
jgi:hypothetical protein